MLNSFWEIISYFTSPTKPVAFIRPLVENGLEQAMNKTVALGVMNPIIETVKNCGYFSCDEVTKIVGYELSENVYAMAPYAAAAVTAGALSLYALKKCCWDSDDNNNRITIRRANGATIEFDEDVDPSKLKRFMKLM